MPSTTTQTLTPTHRDYLVSEGIPESYLEAHPDGFWSYDADTILPSGFEWIAGTPAADGGIVFAWPQVGGGVILQLRPDTPPMGSKGPVKYVGPSADPDGDGSDILRYGVIQGQVSADAQLWVVEGTKQAPAVAAALPGAIVIGLPGIQAWSKGIPADLHVSGIFRHRTVYVVADADAATNRAVYDGAAATGAHSRTAGAKSVRFITVPAVVGDSSGIDDFLATLDEDARGAALEDLASVALSKPAVSAPKRRKAMPVTDFASQIDVDELWVGADLQTEVAAQAILNHSPAAYIADGSLAWYYDGVYRPAEARVDRRMQALVGRLLGNALTVGRLSNVKSRIEGLVTESGRVIPEEASEPIVNHQGGLLDLRTGENRPHTPDHLTTRQLAVEIDLDGECPYYDEWIADRCGEHQAKVIDGLMAAALDPSQISARVGFFFGPTRSGKSTILRLVGAVFGKGQVSGVSLKQFEKSDYAAAELYGKSVNIAADLSREDLADISTFKTLTGDDEIFASKKYGAAFSFVNRASMFFSANEPPSVPADDAYFARMCALAFPRSFVGDEDPEVEERLMEELPAIVGRWAKAYGQKPQEHPAVAEVFRGASDRVARFLAEATVPCAVDIEPGVSLHPGSAGTPGACTATQMHHGFLAWAEAEGGAKMGRNNLIKRAEILGVKRILVGPKANKRALDVRLLDAEEWASGAGVHQSLIESLWPDEGGATGSGGGSSPAPTPPTPIGPVGTGAERATGLAPAELAGRIADHFGTSVIDQGLARALVDAAVWDDLDSMTHEDSRGGLSVSAPSVTLDDLTAAGPLSDPYWTRSVLQATAPAMSAAGIYVRERRLESAGDLSSWSPLTTGAFVSKDERASMWREARAAAGDAVTAKKRGDLEAARAYRDQADSLSLAHAASQGLPSELTAYAVAIDPAVLAPTLGLDIAQLA